MGNNSLIRAFFAIELPDNIKQNIRIFIASFRKKIDSSNIKWVNPDNIHLTIKFLGESDPIILQKIVDRITKNSPPFRSPDLEIGNIGAFPNLFRPRILWAGCSKPKELLDIYKEIDLICNEFQFPLETRNFSPHLTIGRLKGSPSSESIEKIRLTINQSKDIVFGTYKARSLVLFKSDLKPSGPVYTPVNKIDLS